MRVHRSSLAIATLLAAGVAAAQPGGRGPDGPWEFDTHTPGPCSATGAPHGGCPPGELVRIRVTTVVTGLVRPWHLTFLPSGDALVTELPGALRIVRGGKLDAAAVPGWPDPKISARSLNSVVLHPQFGQHGLVYLSYVKARGAETTVAAARARFDGKALYDVTEIYEADAWGTGATAGRAEFGPDGKLYLTVGDRDAANMTDDNSFRMLAQKLDSDAGKVLRLNDDGSIPTDNPFVHMDHLGWNLAVYTFGHRNVQGLAWHPETGELWATEIGPMGGDELNVLKPGSNYGWPVVSLGRVYNGSRVSEQSWWQPGIEMPVMFWMPAISPSSLMIYTGDKFPLWRGHFFIGGLSGQQLQRVAFDQPLPQFERRESMLVPLDARVRDVRQGPDGLIYVLVERDLQNGPGSAQLTPNGSLLRIEPVP
jgi:glucose/arabinose dehydrogenase